MGLLASLLGDNHQHHDQNASGVAACDAASSSAAHNVVMPSSFAAFFPDAAGASLQADHFLPDISSSQLTADHAGHHGHDDVLGQFSDQSLLSRRGRVITGFTKSESDSPTP